MGSVHPEVALRGETFSSATVVMSGFNFGVARRAVVEMPARGRAFSSRGGLPPLGHSSVTRCAHASQVVVRPPLGPRRRRARSTSHDRSWPRGHLARERVRARPTIWSSLDVGSAGVDDPPSGWLRSNVGRSDVHDGPIRARAPRGHLTAHRPVLPNPPSPRAVSSSSVTTATVTRVTGAITSCAMRAPGSMTNGSRPWLIKTTRHSPR